MRCGSKQCRNAGDVSFNYSDCVNDYHRKDLALVTCADCGETGHLGCRICYRPCKPGCAYCASQLHTYLQCPSSKKGRKRSYHMQDDRFDNSIKYALGHRNPYSRDLKFDDPYRKLYGPPKF